jgi:two-component system, chemotaxis family, sensor kinase Cph1
MTSLRDDPVASCEAEPLAFSGAIQSWGALVIIDREETRISHVSANIAEHLPWLSVESLLGEPASAFLGLNALDLNTALSRPVGHRTPSLLSGPSGGRSAVQASHLDVRLVTTDKAVLVEIESATTIEYRNRLLSPLSQSRLFNMPFGKEEIHAYHRAVLATLSELVEFDRMMVYRFHDDWSGEVIAEVSKEGMGSYLGLRFPASDIPGIARALYLQNPCRTIPDARMESVKLLSAKVADPADLSLTDFRSVSLIHLLYLEHMGVRASFSLPIRVGGKLWGLIACHHREAYRPALAVREQCASLTATYAMGLSSAFANHRLQYIDSLDRRIERVLEALDSCADPLDGIEENGPLLCEVVQADGFALAMGQEVVLYGQTPDLENMDIIDHYLLENITEGFFSSHHLASLFPDETLLLAQVSGVMAVKVHTQRSGWVRCYWFRREMPHSVAWAGNPNKPVQENSGAVSLSPRRSFERWVEVMTGYSEAWTNEQRMTATRFRSALLRWL